MLLPYLNKGDLEVGCDEAGRGSLVGSVFAAAVVWRQDEAFDAEEFEAITDSKKLSAQKRETLRDFIEKRALAWAVTQSTTGEIEEFNILHASINAMHKAIRQLPIEPQQILVDGNKWRTYYATKNGKKYVVPNVCVVKGDSTYLSIAAASILAKTYRDDYMRELDKEFPMYHWAKNMGYGTREHLQALRQYGLSPYHRKKFNLIKYLNYV